MDPINGDIQGLRMSKKKKKRLRGDPNSLKKGPENVVDARGCGGGQKDKKKKKHEVQRGNQKRAKFSGQGSKQR